MPLDQNTGFAQFAFDRVHAYGPLHKLRRFETWVEDRAGLYRIYPMLIRTDLRMDDLQPIMDMHGSFGKERGWDATFKAYVAGPLMQFQKINSPKNRIWLAEDGRIVGTVAIVDVPNTGEAQLRWFLVAPDFRGQGLGTRLFNQAVVYAREQRFSKVFLWTEASLSEAAHIYTAAGFQRVEVRPSWKWGAKVVEERWELQFPSAEPAQ